MNNRILPFLFRHRSIRVVCVIVSAIAFLGHSLHSQVRINEVMASNGSTIADEDGDYEDWIELHNYGEDAIDLTGWGLSDNYDNPFKWTFPEGTSIDAGEYLLVWASGKDRAGDSFGLGFWRFDEGGGELVFDRSPTRNNGTLVGDVAFTNDDSIGDALDFQQNGWVDLSKEIPLQNDFTVSYWFRTRRAEAWRAMNSSSLHQRSIYHWSPTRIGFGNPTVNIDLTEAFQTSEWEHIVVSRKGTVVTIYRNGRPVGEGVWTGNLRLDRFGGVSGGTGWQGFDGALADVVILDRHASANLAYSLYRRAMLGPLHTNFSISAAGEEVIFTAPTGTRVDELQPIFIPRDVSVGRVEGVEWFYFAEPTPGSVNDTRAYASLTEPVEFSHAGGFYDHSFELVLSHPDPAATIIYTLDGSTPDPENVDGSTYLYKNHYPYEPGVPFGDFLEHSYRSHIYTDPISIYDRSAEPDKITQIASTADPSPRFHPPAEGPDPVYFPSSPVRKGIVVQALAVSDLSLSLEPTGHSYFVFPTGNPYNTLLVSLQIQEDLLFDYHHGIYTPGVDYDEWRLQNPDAPGLLVTRGNYRRRTEYPARLEIFETGLPEAVINQGIGFRVHGAGSRINPHKNLRLYARSEYDRLDTFRHAFFDERVAFATDPANDLYKRILLRRRGSQPRVFIDPLINRLMQPFFEGVVRNRAAICFVNGEFWGLTNVRDRFDQHHLAFQYNLDPDNIIIVEGRANSFSLDVGIPSDMALFQEMLDLIILGNMADDDQFALLESMLCVRSYVDHLIPKIYFGDTHYEYSFWRVRDPSDSHFGDGRWRMYVQDFDAASIRSDSYLNIRAESIDHFNNMLDNGSFRRRFVNRFADHINVTFAPDRVERIANEVFASLAPYLPEDEQRWGRRLEFNSNVQNYISQAYEQPARQREQIRDYFHIPAEAEVTLYASDGGHGYIRINSMIITGDTPGVASVPYPWTGVYFQNVPVELEAVAEPGHRFVGWMVNDSEAVESLASGGPEFYSMEPVISLSLAGDTHVEALFEPVPEPVLLHYWSFNDETLVPDYSLGGGEFSVTPGPATAILFATGQGFSGENSRLDESAGAHLRVNNPLGATVNLSLPTTGYEEIVLRYESRRSGQGAGLQEVGYTLDGSDFTPFETVTLHNDSPLIYVLDFSEVEGAADNPDFGVRIGFARGDGGEEGNNRFDNITLEGQALAGTNQPPQVVETPDVQKVVAEGSPLTLDLNALFSDPDGDPLTFMAFSTNPAILSVSVDGADLTLSGLSQGEAAVTVEAEDGFNPPVPLTFRVLIYPAPFPLASGNYLFNEWAPGELTGSYPEHMLFVQSDVSDPGLETPLEYAYRIPAEDAANAADVDFPYAATSRTRINGLGADGISFINTGRGRDLGAAVLALDTRGATAIDVSWIGGTIVPNNRIYSLRLQYRVGHAAEWSDVLSGGEPVEYVRAEDPGSELLGPVRLPESLEGEAYVQLQWRYHYLSGTSGPRAQLRLDDIIVSAAPAGESFASWRSRAFADAADREDPAVSGPWADPRGEGIPNLLRYALELGPEQSGRALLPQPRLEEGQLSLVFYRDPAKTDIVYLVEASPDLVDWSEVLYDSSGDPRENTHGDLMEVVDPVPSATAGSRRFLRLRIEY